MFKENDYVVYKRDVCKVKRIKRNKRNGQDYYVLAPVTDDSLIIEVPTVNVNDSIRSLITKEEAQAIIDEIPNVEIITEYHRMIENEYKRLLSTGDHMDLIKIIKTTKFRNNERKEAGKKTAEKDSNYYQIAEKILFYELALVLEMSYEEVKKYVIDKVLNHA